MPQLLPGLVRHTRLRPVSHAFHYPVYQLRLPLRTLQDRRWGNAFLSHNRFNLLSFHDRDHGAGAAPLLSWIDDLLRSEGIDGADGEIWLHTFPRVLGYVFNPVSFWFCESRAGQLRAIVCEVNNTFGERHCYLLADPKGADLAWGAQLQAPKRLYVSPFCEVAGGYRFRFMQAERTGAKGETLVRHVARIDYGDDGGPLLLTSIAGTARPMTAARTLAAFLRMPLMTLGIVARIHLHALRLYIKRLPLVRKPAAPADPVSR
ncbi:DUF1365 domain-containing protein [Lacisediminimonas sp.]|uniref:DUF1365 domain-containing protein n=1 Tax=Lacisediminimonas sp. TaxID=3060582 RepID=UPI00271AED34|nr:DUF1365 domain-containing protein [Lacisediminimonas sp.]MDO8300538.1 DUF1365 domain-containing protein [Lacisediminimonas sp.]